MSSYGWLPFKLPQPWCSENIGTTITANLAAIVTNVSARRAALAHTLFNVTGVIWVLTFYKPILSGVSFCYLFIWRGSVSLLGSNPLRNFNAPSLFNITNTMLLVSSLL